MYKTFNFNLLRRNFCGHISCKKDNDVRWGIKFEYWKGKPKKLVWLRKFEISLYKFHLLSNLYRNSEEREKEENKLKIMIYNTETVVHNGLDSIISFRIPCPCRKSVEALQQDLDLISKKLRDAKDKPAIRKELMKEYQETRTYLDHKEGRLLGSWLFEGTLRQALQEFPDVIRLCTK